MKIVNILSGSAYGYVRAAVTLVLGLLIVIWPGVAVRTLVMVIGAFLIAAGAISFIASYGDRKVEGQSPLLILNGLVSIVFGLILIILPDFFVGIIMFLFGAILLLFGVMQIVNIINVRRVIKIQWISYIVPILVCLCGIVIFFNPFNSLAAIFIFFGIVLIIYGVSEFISTLSFRKAMKESEKDAKNLVD